MLNISDLLTKIKIEGYSEEMAEAKLCQDIILLLLSMSKFNRSITIKGGVVMRSLSDDIRRATIDIDLDLIRYPLTATGIRELIRELNGDEGIRIKIVGKIEDLKHQDYSGKRIHVEIKDSFGNRLSSKMDIGVHNHLSLDQEEYCFDISAINGEVSLLINSKEQMFTEKLKSLVRFGAFSSRFKDVYDLHYLMGLVDKKELMKCFDTLIFKDPNIREKSIDDIISRVQFTFNDKSYLQNLATSNKNWLGIDNDVVLNDILNFLQSLSNINVIQKI